MLDTISIDNLSTVVGGCCCKQQQGADPNAGADTKQPQPQQQPAQPQQPQQPADAGSGGQTVSPCQQLIAGIMQLINQFGCQGAAQK